MRRELLDIADRVRALATTGLHYTEGPFDRERFADERSALVHYIAASSVLHRYVDSHPRNGPGVGEAYYLLGVIESRVGHAFWLSVKALLKSIERDLAQWAVLEAGVSAAALHQIMVETDKKPDTPIDADDVDGVVSDHRYAALWGGLVGSEAEFYKTCADRVSRLSWSEVLAICGPEVRARLEVVRLAAAELSRPIAPRASSCRI